MNINEIGRPLTRKEGPEKVTGAARYGADVIHENMAYAVLVSATIASGRVVGIETETARAVPGVRAVMTHKNLPPLYVPETFNGPWRPMGAGGQQKFIPMRGDEIVYDGQYVAMVIADTFEAAQESAFLVQVTYDQSEATVFGHGEGETIELETLYYGLGEAHHLRGNPAEILAHSPIRIALDLHTPSMHHNPIELHATVAEWAGDRLTVHESTAWPHGLQYGLAEMIGVPRENVRVVSPVCGGSFGGKALATPHTALCALAAREVGRPVRLQLTRPQMFYCVGQRSASQTRVEIGAQEHGKIDAIIIEGIGDTPVFQDWACEPSTLVARHMYANLHMETSQRVKRTNTGPTIPMRAPGETSGMFVIESAINDLADHVGVDPVALRRLNYADQNYEYGLPWSSNSLLTCFERGEELFGWRDRTPEPGSMTRDGKLIGRRRPIPPTARLRTPRCASTATGASLWGSPRMRSEQVRTRSWRRSLRIHLASKPVMWTSSLAIPICRPISGASVP